jgi:hypothetical protein
LAQEGDLIYQLFSRFFAGGVMFLEDAGDNNPGREKDDECDNSENDFHFGGLPEYVSMFLS